MTKLNDMPIGVFDSGIGGLTVLKELIKILPNESFIYLGDTARVPYGTRGKHVIITFALELANFLLKQNVKLLVVACNTISATCLDQIIQLSPVPVIGVIEPAVDEAIRLSRTGEIGVLGTRATVASGVYEREVKQRNRKIQVSTQACPLFVPLVEEGVIKSEATRLIAQEYLKSLLKDNLDTLVLGCTHYPLLRQTIQTIMGPNVFLVDPAKPTAQAVRQVLMEKNLLNSTLKPSYQLFVTDTPERVLEIAKIIFGKNLPVELKLVDLAA